MADADAGGGAADYRAFRARNAKGVLYRLSAMDDPLRARVQTYVHGGAMDADLAYVRLLYGTVDHMGRRDFEQFWEAPWVEEHVRDTARKRKQDAQQRALAVRSYIKASTTGAPSADTDVDSFLSTVDKLTEWEDRHGARDLVKTVSRKVQSLEHTALRTLLQLLEEDRFERNRDGIRALLMRQDFAGTACMLRRFAGTYAWFAALVSEELVYGEATSGARNLTLHMCERLDAKRMAAAVEMVRVLIDLPAQPPPDGVGLPLMSVRGSMCVTRGVLVVMPGGISATYVLDIEGGGLEDLSHVKTIQITQVVMEPDLPGAKKNRRAPAVPPPPPPPAEEGEEAEADGAGGGN
jgi:hypothetical protein